MGQNIIDVIMKSMRDQEEIYSLVATVDSVDEGKMTVDVSPIDDKAPVLSVRMISGNSETPFLIIPKVGSKCVVTFLSRETAFVSLYSEIESVKIRGDQFGGLIKIEELVNQLSVMGSRIDKLYEAFSDAVPVAQDGGAAFQTSAKLILATQIETEDFSDIENENVKHG